MKIAITGATGFIGKHLASFYVKQGAEVIIISRSTAKQPLDGITTLTWESLKNNPQQLEGVHAIINLAGESINQRWTASAKERIVQSRLTTAAALADIISRLQNKPEVVINASGMSIYGISESERFDERSPAHIMDFLSSVVEQWEQAADRIQDTRIIKIRVGIVLGRDGGALPPMLLPYKLFVGGRIGSGLQWMSWIHIEDMIGLIDYCIRNTDINGPVNGTAPHPVRNKDFARTIGKVMGRPNWFPVPSFIFKIVFGELSTLLLDGQCVIPQVLLDHGYKFQYSNLELALTDLL
ncbi:TIGR01777 family protein [Paenibacillus albiflavus]|uniref:TIGR01777 family protein n=1 Tax=Paenibacillus albiflavus TaxID=2545760 RepID=A0A4R4E8V5_9BACL|nr:TIGR01777 family oxidoreductase [Paenibacillus albiflavus]TCZ74248.1 TIGR01777 family protein [Paenibacillus albiflavus]